MERVLDEARRVRGRNMSRAAAGRNAQVGLEQVPLVIDLDGTLVKSDLLIEGVLQLVRRNPLSALRMFAWLLRGKARFKEEIASRIELDASSLPYQAEVLRLAAAAKAQGRQVVLATAAAEKHAHAIARHTAVFDRVLSTGNGVNLSGRRKAELLVRIYGERGFDYAGNDRADLPVWKAARRAIVVNPAPGLLAAVRGANSEVERVFDDRPLLATSLIKQLRVHQWAKNLLIFVPAVAAHRLGDAAAIASCLLGFGALSLTASAVYIINDLLDLPHDRGHPSKRSRPFAAGNLALRSGLVLAPALLLAGAATGLFVSPLFAGTLAAYFAATLAYSAYFKRFAIVDVIFLAGLYTVRVLAGSAAIPVAPSFWLLVFSIFLFLSLAMAKRYVELRRLAGEGRMAASGRGYAAQDVDMVGVLGSGSGLISVLVLALYINSPNVVELYRSPLVLSLLCPILLYWVSWVWLLAHRDLMHEDPVIFAFRDATSLALGVASAVVIAIATFV